MTKIVARAVGQNYFLVGVKARKRTQNAVEFATYAPDQPVVSTWIPRGQIVREIANGVYVKPWIVRQRKLEFKVEGVPQHQVRGRSWVDPDGVDPDVDRDFEFGGW